MFKIVEKKDDKYGIVDTSDGVVEYYTKKELVDIVKQGIKIDGVVNTDNNYKFQVPINENKINFSKAKLLYRDRAVAFTDSQTKEDFITYLNKITGTPVVFNFSNESDLSYLFEGFNGDSLDLSHFDTSKVTNMVGMFFNCKNLQSLNLSHFDTSKVTDMMSMFCDCKSLQSLDLSHFNTSKVTDMANMFYHCDGIQSLDVNHFDTSKVTDMSGMFYKCKSLQHLDISHFNTSEVKNMSDMFYKCISLQHLDVSHFNTSEVKNMSDMFNGCEKLQSLDISHFDISKARLENIFHHCTYKDSFKVPDFMH